MFWIETEIGFLGVDTANGSITRCSWSGSYSNGNDVFDEDNDFTQKAASQLREYFAGKRKDFTLPIKAEGTEFQQKVWNELRNIPYGETATYGDIARRIGQPGAVRAVGMACKNNPIGIIIPCHRVIASGGKHGGYNGGIERKQFLLELEMSFGKD